MTHYVIVLTAISILAVGCAAQARLPNRAASKGLKFRNDVIPV